MKDLLEEHRKSRGDTDAQLIRKIKALLKIAASKRTKPKKCCWFCAGKSVPHINDVRAARRILDHEDSYLNHFFDAVLKSKDPFEDPKTRLKNIWLSGYLEGAKITKSHYMLKNKK